MQNLEFVARKLSELCSILTNLPVELCASRQLKMSIAQIILNTNFALWHANIFHIFHYMSSLLKLVASFDVWINGCLFRKPPPVLRLHNFAAVLCLIHQ